MANLIITVIAIALVAVAALMGAYYGGSAFINNQAAANASTVISQGSQLAGAWNAYLGDNANMPPTALTQIAAGSNNVASGTYLQQIPTAPGAPGGIVAFPIFVATATATVGGNSGTHYFAYADMGKPSSGVTASVNDPNAMACIRVQKTAIGSNPTSLATVVQGQIFAQGNNTFGCAILSGSLSGGLGGASVPAGDLSAGDYVMEYLIQ